MRNGPAVRRAPVHRFATDGALAIASKRNVEQALKHEVIPQVEPVSDELLQDSDVDAFSAFNRPLAVTRESAAITLRPVTTEDIDQLWDWTRQDPEGVTACFGPVAKNSRDLFTGIGRLAEMQTRGQSWLNAITRDAALIGFVLIAPIQRPANQPPVGTVHLYIAQAARGEIDAIVRGILPEIDAHGPMTLSVIVNRPEWTRILEPLGFVSSTVLTRPAAVTSDTHGS